MQIRPNFSLFAPERSVQNSMAYSPIHILSQSITPAASVLNLGFDEKFNFKQHISKICRCCFYHVRDLRRIRRFISLSVAKTIATVLVSSRLDYCNSLLHNTANEDIAKLQRIQNCLARVVRRSPRFSRSAPLLKTLHWLPVHYRFIFKMCTIAYQALSSTQPMLTPARNSRQLRSTSSNHLYIPLVKTKARTRAFSVAAPMVWNSVPASVKSEGNIVSFLFNAAYMIISSLASSLLHPSIDDSRIVLRLRVCLIPWFCRATELDLRRYWRKRSHYYYYTTQDGV